MNPTLAAIKIMGIGMVSIIIVMAIFYIAIKIIEKIFPQKNED